jgi:hypothetical protein
MFLAVVIVVIDIMLSKNVPVRYVAIATKAVMAKVLNTGAVT